MRARMISTLVLAVAILAAACGDSKSSFLPTAPSALSVESPHPGAGSAPAGYSSMGNGPSPGNGNGHGNGNGNGGPGATTDPVSTEKIEFEGLIDAVGNGSITVNARVVLVTTATVIRHGSRLVPFGELRRFDRVHVTATRVGPDLHAVEIKLQNPGDVVVPPPPPDPNQVVTVTASDNSAIEAGADPGTFQLVRTGTATQLAAGLSVSFTLGGTANSADYTIGPAMFQPNETTATVVVTPVDDGVAEPAELVVLTLVAGTGYDPGSPASATVTIIDALPRVSVSVPEPFASEIGINGRFEVFRSGDLSQPLTVTLEFSGTALHGVDYRTEPATTAPTMTHTFAAGEDRVSLTVVVFDDGFGETSETIVLAVLDGAAYDLGTPATGTITIFAR